MVQNRSTWLNGQNKPDPFVVTSWRHHQWVKAASSSAHREWLDLFFSMHQFLIGVTCNGFVLTEQTCTIKNFPIWQCVIVPFYIFNNQKKITASLTWQQLGHNFESFCYKERTKINKPASKAEPCFQGSLDTVHSSIHYLKCFYC